MREVVLTVGFPAAGKSSHIQKLVGSHVRLNRDECGGSLKDLEKKVASLLEKGDESVVLDNTYGTVVSRAPLIKLAKKHSAKIRCLWLKTSIEDAQFNASFRMVSKYGKVLDPSDIKEKSKKDPNCFPVTVLFAYQKQFEEPSVAEGFDEVTQIKFKRELPADFTNKALILDFDGTLRQTKSGEKFPTTIEDIEVLPGRKQVLEKYLAKGYILAGVSNQSGVGKGLLSAEQARQCLDHTAEMLGLTIDSLFCPHNSFPIACYCRKPMPGLGVQLIHKHRLNPSQCIMVGDMTSDKTFAKRCGFQYAAAEDFFKE